jgi:hypothetical protein
MKEAIGLVNTIVARLMGCGKKNSFKPMEGKVLPPSSSKNHQRLLIKELVEVL